MTSEYRDLYIYCKNDTLFFSPVYDNQCSSECTYIGWISAGCEVYWEQFTVDEYNGEDVYERIRIHNIRVYVNGMGQGDASECYDIFKSLPVPNNLSDSECQTTQHCDFYKASDYLCTYEELGTFTERLDSSNQFLQDLIGMLSWMKTGCGLKHVIVDDIIGEYLGGIEY